MPFPNNSALTGYAPVFQQAGEFQFGECLGSAGPPGTPYRGGSPTGISLQVSAFLPRRKIYGWMYINPAANTPYFAKCFVNFFSNGSAVGKLPFAFAYQTYAGQNIDQSAPAVLTTGNTTVQDSITLYVYNAVLGQPSSVILQPFYLYGTFDNVTVTFDSGNNINDLRIWLGVFSTN